MDDADTPMAIARREYSSQRAACCDQPPAHREQLWNDLPDQHRDHLRAFVVAGIAYAEGLDNGQS